MMDKRSCTECLSVLPITDFPKSGGGGGRGGIDTNGNPYRRHQCKPCHWDKKKRLPSGRLENRKRLNNYKHDSSCSCGYSHKRDGNNFHTRALTFHHKNNNKVANISNMMNYSWKKILAEINKCIIICFNCHMAIHGNESH